MHRIDAPSATVDELFTEGSPAGGIPATSVTADWLNDLQEEVCNVVEAAGINLQKGNRTQLLTALQGGFGGNVAVFASPPVPALRAAAAVASRKSSSTSPVSRLSRSPSAPEAPEAPPAEWQAAPAAVRHSVPIARPRLASAVP